MTPEQIIEDLKANYTELEKFGVTLKDAPYFLPGTIIAISHDRYFINRFADKVCVLTEHGLDEYLGNYDDYFEKISREQEPDGATAGMTRTAVEKEKRKSREEERRIKERKQAIADMEKQIEKTEKEIADAETLLADPETYRDQERFAEIRRLYQEKQEKLEQLYTQWETLGTEE